MRRRNGEVRVRRELLALPTFLPAPPDRNPMFLERRVYQGSRGTVYPLPFTDRIAARATPRRWQAVWIENDFVEVLLLPELGGRIHAIRDKSNGYDLIYRQHVIKPALVGLAGPWVSGGIEFNWPQHHRPATFLPADVAVERHPDGSATVWCGDHDPLLRMKGMHGVHLERDRAVVELRVRVFNRTPFVQTFLWWANVATRAHEAYQSFFPPDVRFVADHARRSTCTYPLATGSYYGVDYGARRRGGVARDEVPTRFVPRHCGGPARPGTPDYAPNDLSFYANIPTPCSYMAVGSSGDFVGGYDHAAEAGIVHVADHQIAPGKKQWTWGNHAFGHAWDRNLTEPDADGVCWPYVEIMAGVFTDNQPDFSFLHPGETRSFSQHWYPIRRVGPVDHATVEGAIRLRARRAGRNTKVELGVAVTRVHERARVELRARGRVARRLVRDLAPALPLVIELALAGSFRAEELAVAVAQSDGTPLLSYAPAPPARGDAVHPATEPPAPAQTKSSDELFVTALHLEQYRHATRSPADYWREAIRRDPRDARANHALGVWHLRRGEFAAAERRFKIALARLTERNANPYDGEPLYHLGLCLRLQGRDDEAYDAFAKATWNHAWQAAAFHALGEIDARRGDFSRARERLEAALRRDPDHSQASNLLALVLRRGGDEGGARRLLEAARARDPLDWWTRHLLGEPIECDLQVKLDLAHDHARAGFDTEAIDLLAHARARPRDLPDQSLGARPLVEYTLGWLHERRGDRRRAAIHYARAEKLPPDWCFPSRLEELAILQAAIAARPRDARAHYYLGNWLFDRRRHGEAIAAWERAAGLDPEFPTVWRNLGIARFNVRRDPRGARAAYERACRADPGDARLLFERDQLSKRLAVAPRRRLRELERHLPLVERRDDLTVEFAALLNQAGRPERALAQIESRRFQPWEGGEGGPLAQHVRAHLALGRRALAAGDAGAARGHFEAALAPGENLGEARHLLASPADVHYWLGVALDRLGDSKGSREHWRRAATFRGNFQEMAFQPWSELTWFSALAWRKLGRPARARRLLSRLLDYALKLRRSPACIDYFATSLPTMLLFEDDLEERQRTKSLFLEAQARIGLGEVARGRRLLARVLRREPDHPLALELAQESGRRP
jgi:tetratricopeptide (TPR) repeat protein